MDNEKKQQLELLRGCSSVLKDTLASEGYKEHLFLGASQKPDEQGYEIFAYSEASTAALGHMFLFLLERLPDDRVGVILHLVLNHPGIAAKMAAFQAMQMTKRAEMLKAQAAATAPQPEQAPEVPEATKNKSWLN